MPRTFTHAPEVPIPEPTQFSPYRRIPPRCRGCGNEDTIKVSWHETTYGTADLRDLNGDLDNYETTDTDNFEIDSYRCIECDLEGNNLNDVVLGAGEEWEENEE